MTKKFFPILLIFISSFVSIANAQEIVDPMNPPRLVNDFASFLSPNQTNQLEGKLRQFNSQTSTQIYVVIVKQLNGYAPGDYATRLGEKWGIGQKGKDNGIVLLVKPKSANSRGEVFISTGYGLEGVVPDIIANQIVDNEVIPSFKNGQYYSGIDKAVSTLISLTKGEFTAAQYHAKAQRSSRSGGGGGRIIFFIILIVFSLLGGGRNRMGRHSGVGRSLPFFLLLGMMNSGGRSHGGSFGNFSGGGGFGGFGGGGGGSFGGGGAGGSW